MQEIKIFFLLAILLLLIPTVIGIITCITAQDVCRKLLGFYCFLSNIMLILLCSFQDNLVYVLDIDILGILLIMVMIIFLIKIWQYHGV